MHKIYIRDRRGAGLGSGAIYPTFALLLSDCVILDRLLVLSEPCFLIC